MTHYYGAGCQLVNLQTGAPYAEAEILAECKQLLVGTPAGCVAPFENLRSCWAGVPDPSTTNAQCDCSQEQDALSSCK